MSDPKISQTKAARFIRAYIESGFNATEAARRTCAIGSRGAANPQHSAEVVGARMLRSAECRKYLEQLLSNEIADGAYILQELYQHSRTAPTVRERLKALELLGKHKSMFTDRHEVNAIDIGKMILQQDNTANAVNWQDIEMKYPLEKKTQPPREDL